MKSLIQKSGILFFILILTLACQKSNEIKDVISRNALSGVWQLSYAAKWSGGYRDSLYLVEAGFMCNMTISTRGEIEVYGLDTQIEKLAIWKIVNIDGDDLVFPEELYIDLKKKWPDSSKKIYRYSVNTSQFNSNIYEFWPSIENGDSEFFNTKHLQYGDGFGYCFRRK